MAISNFLDSGIRIFILLLRRWQTMKCYDMIFQFFCKIS